ncbi:hypothetical protein M8J76_006142 [Diaphorina citri]|nr:hypothetical protein M8J76_006142 [Diaphorina citri]
MLGRSLCLLLTCCLHLGSAKLTQTFPYPFSSLNTLAYPYNYMHIDQLHHTDRFEAAKMGKYRLFNPADVPDKLIKDCEKRKQDILKGLESHYAPEHLNISIEYFHHPKTRFPTPNYKVNIMSDMFGGMRMSERISALDVFLEPMLLKPYRLTINARLPYSAEFHDTRAEREELKREYAKYLEDGMKMYHQPGPLEAKMKAKLVEAFEPEICEVTNQSYKYDEPDDAETHFCVAVISYKFVRKTIKEAEEMVRYILRDDLPKLKSVDVPEVLPTLLPTPKPWYRQVEYSVQPVDVEAWPF